MNNIRTKVRAVARLAKQLQHDDVPYTPLAEYFVPAKYNEVRDAVNGLSRDSPQLGLALGHYVKQLCKHKIAKGIIDDCEDVTKEAENFEKLYNDSWSFTVSARAARRQKLAKLNKVQQLPSTEDLQTVTLYLESEMKKEVENSDHDVQTLTKLTLTSLIVFNKRRPTEVAELKTADLRRAHQDDNTEMLATLTPSERLLAQRYVKGAYK